MLLRQVDSRLGLLDAVNEVLPDPRDPRYISHQQREMLAARVFAIAASYEDGNDHQHLRHDPALQVAAEKQPEQDAALASPSTLCRLENRVDRKSMVAMHEILVDQFIPVDQFLDSYERPPEEIALDFDATDDPVHGNQQGCFFHGYYGNYCYLPLYVFCGSHPLVAYLRRSNIDGAKHSRAILRLLVHKIRQRWPDVKIDDGLATCSMFAVLRDRISELWHCGSPFENRQNGTYRFALREKAALTTVAR